MFGLFKKKPEASIPDNFVPDHPVITVEIRDDAHIVGCILPDLESMSEIKVLGFAKRLAQVISENIYLSAATMDDCEETCKEFPTMGIIFMAGLRANFEAFQIEARNRMPMFVTPSRAPLPNEPIQGQHS